MIESALKSSSMPQCPNCGSADTRRSRLKSAWETWRSQITATCPYRCGKCGWRGWSPGIGSRRGNLSEMADRENDAPRPILTDVLFAAGPPGVDELDLDALDIPPKQIHEPELF